MRWLLLTLMLTALFAGCTDSPDADTDSVLDDSLDAVAEPVYELQTFVDTVENPVDEEGHTKEGVWLLCDGLPGSVSNPLPAQCLGQQIQPDGAFQHSLIFEGNLTGVELTLDWTKADATQFGLEINIRDGQNGPSLGTWNGASTFTIDEELSASGNELFVSVWPVAKDGRGNFVDLTQQDYTITGTIFAENVREEMVEVERTEERLVEDA